MQVTCGQNGFMTSGLWDTLYFDILKKNDYNIKFSISELSITEFSIRVLLL